MRSSRVLFLALITAMLGAARKAIACAVCFGDAESPMAKGAVAGVIVLGAIVSFVLVCVACIGLTWLHRSRRISPPTGPRATGRN